MKELCCSKSIVSFEKFVSICLTTSYMDFSLYMDFYFVICVLCPPEAATSRFLFHVTVLSACSYQKGESEKGKLEEGTTQTLPCRWKPLLSQTLLKNLTRLCHFFSWDRESRCWCFNLSLPLALRRNGNAWTVQYPLHIENKLVEAGSQMDFKMFSVLTRFQVD